MKSSDYGNISFLCCRWLRPNARDMGVNFKRRDHDNVCSRYPVSRPRESRRRDPGRDNTRGRFAGDIRRASRIGINSDDSDSDDSDSDDSGRDSDGDTIEDDSSDTLCDYDSSEDECNDDALYYDLFPVKSNNAVKKRNANSGMYCNSIYKYTYYRIFGCLVIEYLMQYNFISIKYKCKHKFHKLEIIFYNHN